VRLGELPIAEPSPDLWRRIAQAHQVALHRARRRRLALWSASAIALVAVLVGANALRAPTGPAGEVDWQARAQALELQLRDAATTEGIGALPAEAYTELVRVDGALQAAYDEGAEHPRVTALWKRRSELLNTLLQARRGNVEITRI
jgi:hypothetical protein